MVERSFICRKGNYLSLWFRYSIHQLRSVFRNDSIHEWCLSVLDLSASNQIIGQNWNLSLVAVTGPVLPINTWTHLVTSYSPSTGLSLWVNGSLVSSPIQMTIAAANAPLFLTLGSRALTSPGCATGDIDGGQFYGMMDELRVYSRELEPSEICSLAYPRDY